MASVKALPGLFKANNFLLSVQHALRAMDQFLDEYEAPALPSNFEDLRIPPSMDIVEDATHFKIEFEMPGMSENDIHVSIDNDGVLTVRGEKETSRQDHGKHYLAREINYGIYERNIALPQSVDFDKAEISFKKGMLWVRIPKHRVNDAEHDHSFITENIAV